jgi:hypothetical protein
LVCYLWLSYKFPGIFRTQALAMHIKHMVEERIEKLLNQYTRKVSNRELLKDLRQKAIIAEIKGNLVKDVLGNEKSEGSRNEATEAVDLDADSDAAGVGARYGEQLSDANESGILAMLEKLNKMDKKESRRASPIMTPGEIKFVDGKLTKRHEFSQQT